MFESTVSISETMSYFYFFLIKVLCLTFVNEKTVERKHFTKYDSPDPCKIGNQMVKKHYLSITFCILFQK